MEFIMLLPAIMTGAAVLLILGIEISDRLVHPIRTIRAIIAALRPAPKPPIARPAPAALVRKA
jgi:hypothetical protein